ncbi:MAG: SRPBCC domain-containing protein [Solirubrobacterales bacterium]
MTERSVRHATFTVERTYDASPARVFAAWAEPAAKARWFGDPAQGVEDFELDFRIGGREFNRGTVEGQAYTYEARYQDIVPDERIVYAYDMHADESRISVSLGTVELEADGAGTRLTYTEQGRTSTASTRPSSASRAPAGCSTRSPRSWRARPSFNDRLFLGAHPVTTGNRKRWRNTG